MTISNIRISLEKIAEDPHCIYDLPPAESDLDLDAKREALASRIIFVKNYHLRRDRNFASLLSLNGRP